MDGATQPSEIGPTVGDSTNDAEVELPSISRRRFTTITVGAGSLAVGGVWASPKITTIRFARKAAVGSPPPGPTTTTTVVVAAGQMSVSVTNPCEGDDVRVTAKGFAPKTAVTLEIDSAANTLGVTTADGNGELDTIVKLHKKLPTGDHQLMLVGVRPGGRTLTIATVITIRTEAECKVAPEATTTTTTGTTTTTPVTNQSVSTTSTPATTVPATTPPNTAQPPTETHKPTHTGEGLTFTGTDTTQLALLGAAAAVAGRMLYGVAAGRGDDPDDDDADDTRHG